MPLEQVAAPIVGDMTFLLIRKRQKLVVIMDMKKARYFPKVYPIRVYGVCLRYYIFTGQTHVFIPPVMGL
jgi:hypothetical protein